MYILNNIFIIAIYMLPLLLFLLAAVIFLQVLRKRGKLARSLNMSLFSVVMPKEQDDDSKPDIKDLISRAEQLYSILGSIKAKGSWNTFINGPLYLALEIASVGKEIDFYISIPKRREESIVKHIQGIYPESEVQRVKDYNIFNPRGFEAASSLALKKDCCFPIKTYKKLEADALGEVTNVLSKIKNGEGGAIQVIFKEEHSGWRRICQSTAREMQSGKSYGDARSAAKKGVLGEIANIVKESAKTGDKNKESAEKFKDANKPVTPMHQEILKAIEEKSGKMGFGVNIRLVASALTSERANELLGQMEDAFSQFNDPNLNSFGFAKEGIKNIIYNFSFRNYNDKKKMILNTEELASVFHFPSPFIKTPKIKWLKSRTAPPPIDLPESGIVIGKNVFRGEETKVRIGDDDRRRHFYMIGQTGTGKSALMQEMIRQDIEEGHGVCVIDPHGDLIDRISQSVPKERIEDVILFDPSDVDLPIGLNMLEYNQNKPEQKTFIVNEMIGIFQKIFSALPESMGPMFEQYTRNALLLLMDNPEFGFTLMDVPRVVVDADFRHFLLEKEKNIVVKEFWIKEAEKAGGEASLANMAPYINSKFNTFTANDYIRPIIGQSKSGLNFREIMDNKKILLVNLTKGKLGDINSSLLGLIIVGKILLASFSRVDMPEDERKDFYLYIDEFQNFTTDSVASILAEARKYRLNLTIAHQFIGQLQDNIRDAVFGNVGSMAAFRVGSEDAEFVSKQFKPVFSEQDLINIDNFNAYVKILVDGKTSRPFNITTYPPVQGSIEIAGMVKDLSRNSYGRPKEEVEKEILHRAKLAEEYQDNSF